MTARRRLVDRRRRNNVIQFPQRGPFAVRVERDGVAWIVVCRDHGWLHGDERNAIRDAESIAHTFGVGVAKDI